MQGGDKVVADSIQVFLAGSTSPPSKLILQIGLKVWIFKPELLSISELSYSFAVILLQDSDRWVRGNLSWFGLS